LSACEGGKFDDRPRQAFAVLMTGETAKYGNILLKKGETPIIRK
jgi:L-fucose mutarotase